MHSAVRWVVASSTSRRSNCAASRCFSSLKGTEVSYPSYSSYNDAYSRASNDPIDYWLEASRMVSWFKSPSRDKILTESVNEDGLKFNRWYSDGVLNTCYNALDYHVERGFGERVALFYDSPETNSSQQISYSELLQLTSHVAGALERSGVKKGDCVLLYLPMIPATVAIMLACARIGAIHSVVFGGFAPNELAKRIVDAKPKVIFSASCGIDAGKVIAYKPMLDSAIEIAKFDPELCVIIQRPQANAELKAGRDIEWNEFLSKRGKAIACFPCVPLHGTDPLYTLYTSGTTGPPKGVLRDNGGHAVAMKWVMRFMMNLRADDVIFCTSQLGWVVGHAFICYGPLMSGMSSVLYEGKPNTPNIGAYWRVAAQYKAKAIYTAPTALRAIKKDDPSLAFAEKHDLTNLKSIFVAGERADPDTVLWAAKGLAIPIYDNYWQTECTPCISNLPGLQLFPVKAGSATKPVPGYILHVLDDSGKQITEPETEGNLALKLPLPPGFMPSLWNNDARFHSAYLKRFVGYYDCADSGHIDKDGYVWIMGRTDDVMNVAAHRLSSGQMEEAVCEHPAVGECAVIGVSDQIKGQVPVAVVVIKSSATVKDEAVFAKEISTLVRNKVGPIASLKSVIIVPSLPKTKSGKILRNVMRKIADGQEYQVPPTIEDLSVIANIEKIFKDKIIKK